MKEAWRLAALLRPVAPQMLLALFFSLLAVAANVGLMSVSAYLIAAAALHPPLATLALAITGVRFLGTSRAVFRYGERYFSHRATFHILGTLRVWFYRQIEPLAPAGLAGGRLGEVLGMIMADIDTLQFFYLRVLAPPITAMGLLLAMGLFLGYYSSGLVCILLVSFLLGGLFLPLGIQCLGRKNGDKLLRARGQYKAQWVDILSGLPEVLGQEHNQCQRRQLHVTQAEYEDCQKRANGLSALSDGGISLLTQAAVVAALLVLVPLIRAGLLEPVMLAVLVLALQSCFEALQPLPMAAYTLRESLASARRLFELTDSSNPLSARGNQPVPTGKDFVFEQVVYQYPGEVQPALSKVSFTLGAGKKVAVVGSSGAGKTTLLHLLLGFADCTEGRILYDGKDSRKYEEEEFRRLFAVVEQGHHIFHTTLADNIRIADPSAKQAKIAASARIAELDMFISTLLQGYQSSAGANGRQLSGGQRQRLALARAILKEAPVFVLDEPTAGLDPVTETKVIHSLLNHLEDKTLLLITHRLAGLECMDQILFLHNGQVAEQGSWTELIKAQGQFARWKSLQEQLLQEQQLIDEAVEKLSRK